MLRLDDHFVDTSKLSPEDITLLISVLKNDIIDRSELIYNTGLDKARHPENRQRGTVLVARLALLGSERSAFIPDALQALQKVYTTPRALNSRGLAYWQSVENAGFVPEIKVRSSPRSDNDTLGTWLGAKALSSI